MSNEVLKPGLYIPDHTPLPSYLPRPLPRHPRPGRDRRLKPLAGEGAPFTPAAEVRVTRLEARLEAVDTGEKLHRLVICGSDSSG